MSELHWGVDDRTHRVGANGQTLCKTMIDYSRPPERRVISGCEVCDIVYGDMDRPGSTTSGRTVVVIIVVVVLISLLVLAAG
jgi:hypothetical protein